MPGWSRVLAFLLAGYLYNHFGGWAVLFVVGWLTADVLVEAAKRRQQAAGDRDEELS